MRLGPFTRADCVCSLCCFQKPKKEEQELGTLNWALGLFQLSCCTVLLLAQGTKVAYLADSVLWGSVRYILC